MKRSDFRFTHRLRVRWAEVDMQRIVFNAHYLAYVDTALADYWRALGLPYPDAILAMGGDLYVKKTVIEYHGSAHYDDLLDVGLRCARVGNSSMTMSFGILRQDTLLVEGELVYVFADPEAQKSRPLPPVLREVLQAFEAGEPMVEIQVGDWATLGVHAKSVRTEVFVEEQGIPAELEWDEADATSVHAVAYSRFGMPLATGRMHEHVPGVAKIGRMAVKKAMRGSRVGRLLLDALMQAANQRGYQEALLHAQLSAAPFYARAGFTPRGPHFDEVGIPHVEMTAPL